MIWPILKSGAYPGISPGISPGEGGSVSKAPPPGNCPGEGGSVSIAPLASNVLNKKHIPEDIDK